MSELKISAEMFPVAGWDELFAAQEEGRFGAFFFQRVVDCEGEHERLVVLLPDHSDDEAAVHGLPLRQTTARRPSWEFDGNRDRPTLTPSVHSPGNWHGFITAGRLVSC